MYSDFNNFRYASHSQGFLRGFIATDFTVALTCIREACWPPISAQERSWLASLQGAERGRWPSCRVQEEGLLASLQCAGRGLWTLPGPQLCFLSHTFFLSDLYRKPFKISGFYCMLYMYIHISFIALATDTYYFFKNAENLNHQWANTSTYSINKSF